MIQLVWLVPLLPLLGFLLIGGGGKRISKSLAGAIGSLVVLGAFVVSLLVFVELSGGNVKSHTVDLFSWIQAGNLKINFSFLVDPLSSLYLLFITGIGFLIHLYSAGYMHDDEAFNRFFAYLNLFVFFMLLLVLGSNYLIMFVGWEGVGLCSYLLIGFWFKNTAYNNAAKKAFIMNRIGDLGFLLGVLLIFVKFGSISYADVFDPESLAAIKDDPSLIAITLLLFVGAMGKSAQLPLYTWLPDAMAGPTPVSALIHAATMVTAGIYMIVRSNVLYTLAPFSQEVIAIVGVVTALFAATIGLFQNDIKKVLAYSTVSQLGYMFLALGVGAYTAGVFHVVTHAFFKALLFLGAGSVIHAMSGEQDIRRMGGLKKHLPITYITFLVGTAAIAGIPGLSGFFSKDEILAHVFEHNKLFWGLGVVTAFMTAFYMFRLYYLTFRGDFRGTEKQLHHLHESPKSMTIPLIVLAVFAVIGGAIGLPWGKHWLKEFLHPVTNEIHHPVNHTTEYTLMAIAIVVALSAIALARLLFISKGKLPAESVAEMNPLQRLVYNKYYVDEIYETLITKPFNGISTATYKFFEVVVLDGLVNGIGTAVNGFSRAVRYIQTGNTGFYIMAMVVCSILILFFGILYKG